MSTQESLQSFPGTQGGDAERLEAGPGSRERLQTREARVTKSRRIEIGVFIRKVVDGRVVRQWQLPPVRRREVQEVVQQEPRKVSAPVPDQHGGGDEEQVRTETFALRSTTGDETDLGSGLQATSGSGGANDTGPIHESRYEVGAFFSSTTTTEDSDSDD